MVLLEHWRRLASPESLEQIRLERLRYLRDLQRQASQVKKGVAVYANDPIAFINDCVDFRDGPGLAPYQEDIIGNLAQYKREAVRGPHGLGKSCIAALTIWWFCLTRDATDTDWKVVTTAGAWRQLIHYLWPEIRKWATRLRWDKIRDQPLAPRELLSLHIRLRNGEAFAAACSNPALIEGCHADSVLFVYDESKRLDVLTPIPTPAGWSTMGDLKPGDVVLDEEGKPTTVTWVSPVVDGRPCSKITFSDGAELVADGGHQWLTLSARERFNRRNGALGYIEPGRKRAPGMWGAKPKDVDWRDHWDDLARVQTTSDMAEAIAQEREHRPPSIPAHYASQAVAIATCRPLDLPEAELPIDPYTLGAWLGDGDSWHGVLTSMDDEIPGRIGEHYEVRPRPKPGERASRYGIIGLHGQLRRLGVFRNKHIPVLYLRASAGQRLALLQGLMDTDGTNNNADRTRSSRVAYSTVSERLAEDVAELVRTFGWKVNICKGTARLRGMDMGPVYILRWRPDICPFYLPRKAARWEPAVAQRSRSTIRTVVSVEPAESRPTRCIGVDSPRHLYLAGKSFIPTHNSIPSDTFDACEGAFSGTGEALALALSTPGEPAGRFYDICSRRPGYEDWRPRHVTLDEAIGSGRISDAWAEQRRLQWGEISAIYQNRVLGEFYAGDEDCIIPLAWAEAAVERWHMWQEAGYPDGEPHVVGVDPARMGEDRTAIAIRLGPVIKEIRTYAKEDTMATVGRVKGILDADPEATAMVDVIGVGAGVLDRLREMGMKAEPFTASGKTRKRDKTGELTYLNCVTGDTRVQPVGRLRRIYRSWHDGPLYRVKTASGDEFTVTPHHNVLTLGGWAAVKTLSVGDKLCYAGPGQRPPAGEPQVGYVPPAIGEVYGAASRLYGLERVVGSAVNFHGDRPVGNVEVVTVDSQLHMVSPALGQQAEDAALIGLLFGEGGLPRERHLPLAFGMSGRHAGGVRRHEPPAAKTRGPAGVPVRRDCPGGQLVRLLARPPLDAVGVQHSRYSALVDSEGRHDLLGPVTCDVPGHDLDLIDRQGIRQGPGLGAGAWLEAALAEEAAQDWPGDAGGFARRALRFPGEVPADEVISIEVISHPGPVPVYTLETATGAYRTSSIVQKNCRAAAWYQLREMLDPSAGAEVCLPDDENLLSDLSAPHGKEPLSGGVLRMEGKDEIRARIGRSTDRGDAVVQAFWRQSGSWDDVYGILTCESCGKKFYKARDRCPACGERVAPLPQPEEPAAEPVPAGGEPRPYPAGDMRPFATVGAATAAAAAGGMQRVFPMGGGGVAW